MNTIVDRIATGKATLLGIDDICTRLGISRTTFDRWVRNGSKNIKNLKDKDSVRQSNDMLTKLKDSVRQRNDMLTKLKDNEENRTEGAITFPPPDIRIGNSPKWELDTFKHWLQANVTTNE